MNIQKIKLLLYLMEILWSFLTDVNILEIIRIIIEWDISITQIKLDNHDHYKENTVVQECTINLSSISKIVRESQTTRTVKLFIY